MENVPSTEEILIDLARLANDYLLLAVVWHAAVFLALVAIVSERWRPSRRGAALLLTLPLLSVSSLAFVSGNPVNGIVFLGFAIASAAIASRMTKDEVSPGPMWATGVGAGMLVLALLYPHFLEGRATWTYLFAAPVGVIPCPTLALVLGFGLLAGGFASRVWSWLFAIAGFVYGVTGIFKLGVWLDAGLFAGAIALVAASASARAPLRVPFRSHRKESARRA